MHFSLLNHNMSQSTIKRLLLIALAGCFVFSCGCEQQRYQPSAWRPATGGGNTLPGMEEAQAGTMPVRGSLPSRYGSLPLRGGSLPMRAGTLPMRGNTLPQRSMVQSGNKTGKRPLPTVNVTVWDTSAKKSMAPPSRTPEFSFGMMPSRGASTLPIRGGTLPSRRGTLPARRGYGGYSSGNTLPNR
jgi:hypothetical protein